MMRPFAMLKGRTAILLGMLLLMLSLSPTRMSLAGDSTPQQPTPTGSLPEGSVARGRDLFMGTAHFTKGGPPCMGCHNVDSLGLLGGGAVGPDLTNVSRRYDDAALAKLLATIPTPTMNPIYTARPLTPQEQADLKAFLKASDGQPVSNREPYLWALSLGGLVAAVAFFGVVYRRRLKGVRRPLVEGTRSIFRGK